MAADPAPLVSPARHRAQRDRLARLPADANFRAPIIAETLLDRLSMVTRTFSRTLLIGAHDPAFADRLRATGTELALIEAGPCLAARSGAMIGEADAIDLPFASFDLIEIGRATSELPSLMRISSAVFCLKKKTTKKTKS